MNFFKPEDFDWLLPEIGSSSKRVEIADYCQAKLEREGKVVYCVGENPEWFKSKNQRINGSKPDKKALLINIEKIEGCKHPIEKIKANDPNVIHGFICICGVKVRPTGFEVVE